MISHEFPGGAPRCIYCSTLATQHERTACPGPQGQPAVKLLPPLPDKQRERAADEVDQIHARILELRAEADAELNRVTHVEEEGGDQN